MTNKRVDSAAANDDDDICAVYVQLLWVVNVQAARDQARLMMQYRADGYTNRTYPPVTRGVCLALHWDSRILWYLGP